MERLSVVLVPQVYSCFTACVSHSLSRCTHKHPHMREQIAGRVCIDWIPPPPLASSQQSALCQLDNLIVTLPPPPSFQPSKSSFPARPFPSVSLALPLIYLCGFSTFTPPRQSRFPFYPPIHQSVFMSPLRPSDVLLQPFSFICVSAFSLPGHTHPRPVSLAQFSCKIVLKISVALDRHQHQYWSH